jgi:hypothetical protein
MRLVLRRFLLVILSLLGGFACTPSVKSEAQYYQWLNDPENGLVQVKEVNDLILTAKFLPPQLLAQQELKRLPEITTASTDSLVQVYANSYSFLLTIQPQNSQQDVLFRDLESYPQYKERVTALNFHADQFLALQVGDQSVPPVLHIMENTYSTRSGRSLYLVFPRKALSNREPASDLDLVFTDELFQTGINHFIFSAEDLATIPTIF